MFYYYDPTYFLLIPGLLLALYVQPERAWAIRQDDNLWTLHGQSRKGGALFVERFDKAIDQRSPSHASD